MANNGAFHYHPLEPGKIRLLRITDSQNSQYELYHCNEGAEYHALSYCWGAGPASCPIRLNGTSVRVRKNLWRFLKQAHVLGDIWYWIDAICINQSDEQERTEQVSRMHTIYSGAQRVVAWLGEAHHNSDTAMAILSSLESLTEADAIARLCHRQYWTRLWVFQELMLAKELIFLCSQQTLQLHSFLHLLDTVNKARGRILNNYDFKQIADSPAIAMFKLLDTGSADLWTLIMRTARLDCTDPRDKVYGLLAIANPGITADYQKPMHVLLSEVLRSKHLIEEPTDCNDIIQHCRDLVAATLREVIDPLQYMTQGVPQTPLTRQYPFKSPETNVSAWWAWQHDNPSVAKVLTDTRILHNDSFEGLSHQAAFHEDPAFKLLASDRNLDAGRLSNYWLWDILKPRHDLEFLNHDTLWILDRFNITATHAHQPSFLHHLLVSGVLWQAGEGCLDTIAMLVRSSAFHVADSRTMLSSFCESCTNFYDCGDAIVCILENEVPEGLWGPLWPGLDVPVDLSRSLWPGVERSAILTALCCSAARCGNWPVVRWALARPDFDINGRNDVGDTALHSVLTGRELSWDLIREMLGHGSNTSITNFAGDTVLHRAVMVGDAQLIKMLLDAGCPVTIRNHSGETALHVLARSSYLRGSREIAAAILHKTESILNIRDNNGMTALHVAVHWINKDIFNELMARPLIDTTIRDNDARLPVDVVNTSKWETLVLVSKPVGYIFFPYDHESIDLPKWDAEPQVVWQHWAEDAPSIGQHMLDELSEHAAKSMARPELPTH